MVVKSKLGRKRYIIIKIDSDSVISKHDLIHTLNRLVYNAQHEISQQLDEQAPVQLAKDMVESIVPPPTTAKVQRTKTFIREPWVISLKNNYGLIRCHHLDKDKTIKLLRSIRWAGKGKNSVKIRTLGTTGTIRGARKKYLDKLILYPSNNVKMKRV